MEVLCCSDDCRNEIFEHLMIGLMRQKVEGKVVILNLQPLMNEYAAVRRDLKLK